MSKTQILSFLLILFASCQNINPVAKTDHKELQTKQIIPIHVLDTLIAPPTIDTLDTTILIDKLLPSSYNGPKLNKALVQKVLKAHFKKKGYLVSPNEFDDLAQEYHGEIEMTFDTFYNADINHNQFPDAIVAYWLAPPMSSGHCIQPQYAIIIDQGNKYVVTNEDFIPTNFPIDSVVSRNNQTTIFACDYECANFKILRYLHLHLKSK